MSLETLQKKSTDPYDAFIARIAGDNKRFVIDIVSALFNPTPKSGVVSTNARTNRRRLK